MQSNFPVNLRKHNGFTLIELLTVVTIIIIVSAYGIPTLRGLIWTSQISSNTSTLHSALLFTRSEAIKRSVPVTICRSTNPSTTTPSCATTNSLPTSNTGWGSGWIIFTDLNGNGVYEPAGTPAEVLIAAQDKFINLPTDGSIIPSPQRRFISFQPTGQTFGNFVQFAVNRPDADTNASHDRFICIAQGGRARVDTTSCTVN
jgi:type IV fimbrial biogenesis protein FimT